MSEGQRQAEKLISDIDLLFHDLIDCLGRIPKHRDMQDAAGDIHARVHDLAYAVAAMVLPA